jgi:hypothetical protein
MDLDHSIIRLEITYSPGTGSARIADEWRGRGRASSFSLVSDHNVLRDGREGLYRAMREVAGQYLDIMDARWQESPHSF